MNLLESWERKNDLQRVKQELERGRKRESQREYKERVSKERPVKTYKEYLDEAKNQPPSPYLAPLTARPKTSRGDSHRSRRRDEAQRKWGQISVYDIPHGRDGSINISALRRMVG